MTLQWIGLAAAWLASAYRLWVSFRQPPTIWRTAFTVGIFCAALGVTLQSLTPQVDALTAPSVGSLLNHVVIIVGLASVQVYVAALRRDVPPPGLLRRVVVIAITAEVVTGISWILAEPFHAGESEHFAVYATDPWVSVYFLMFWALLAVTMVEVAKFCLLDQRGSPPEDRARVISLGLIGLGAVGGLLYALAAAAGAIYIAATGVLDDKPLMASSRLIGPSIGLLGVGILALLVVPPLDSSARSRRRLRVLRPLWNDLQRVVPAIRLGGSAPDQLASATAVERAVIEIRDALEVVPILPPAQREVTAVAVCLREEFQRLDGSIGLREDRSDAGRCPAAAFLPRSKTQSEDTEQVYALALEYRRLQRDGRRPHAPNSVALPDVPA